MNNIILKGRLCHEPTIRFTHDQKAVASYTLAVQGYTTKDTDFINCVCYGKTAEFAEKHLTQGKEILVQGRLKPNVYTDSEGVKHYSYNVIVNLHEFCGRKSDNSGDATSGSKNGSESPVTDEDDLPFN